MTNWADFLLLLTNKLVKPICVSIFVLTFHRILSSSHSQSPGSRKPWFMFSVWLIAVLPVFLPPPPRFISLPPAFPILLFPVFLSFSWEYAFNVVFPSFSIFFFCLCARGLISLPHPVSFSFFQIRSRWELVLESYVLLASLYGSCDFFFEPLRMVGCSLRLLSHICCQTATLVGPAVPHCMLGLPVRVNWQLLHQTALAGGWCPMLPSWMPFLYAVESPMASSVQQVIQKYC